MTLEQCSSVFERQAKVRGLPFTLNDDTFFELTSMPCDYCGTPPSSVHAPKAVNGSYQYNDLDRVDNSLGYEYNNVVPCCKACNRAKFQQSRDEFLAWVERVYLHNGKHD